MEQQETAQTEQAWQDPSKVKTENINSVYQSYVQYPTGHIPKQQQAAPTNQPKLSNKNPVMHLNELRKGLTYDITGVSTCITEETVVVKTEASSEDGTAQTVQITPESANKKKKKQQEMAYSCNVKVDGEVFTGTGKSQKVAKQEACKYALLKKFNILYVPGYEKISDDTSIFTATKRKGQGKQNGPSPKKQKSTVPKNALMVLNETIPGLSYNVLSQSGPVHAPTFTISVEIDGQTFTGSGTSKKAARLATAQSACNALNLEYMS